MKLHPSKCLLLALATMRLCSAATPERIYEQHCAQCHDASAVTHAPSRASLAQSSPELIVAALSPGGLMQQPGGPLTVAERRAVAIYLTGKQLGQQRLGAASQVQCKSIRPADFRPLEGPRWNDWGVDLENTRFQPAEMANLAPAAVPRLHLKWAFAFPNASSANTPPVIGGGRLFVASTNHKVYSLDAESACTYWVFDADAIVRGAVVLAQPTVNSPVWGFFGDAQGNVYALDAASGQLKWKINVQEFSRPTSLYHPYVMGTVKVADGMIFVPVDSDEESMAGLDPSYECCKSRGAILALDAATGKQRWRTETIREPARQSGLSAAGTPRWGPSGVGVWSTPTLDTKLRVLYIGTGDDHSTPVSDTGDAVVALDMATGRILWSRQLFTQDSLALLCLMPDRRNCPVDVMGPDFDFASPPILVTLPGGGRALIAGQKSGVVHALDPDNQGAILWETRVAQGGLIGGVEFGMATDGHSLYAPVSDADFAASNSNPSSTQGQATQDVLEALKGIIYLRDHTRGGGLLSLDVSTGRILWHAPPIPCAPDRALCAPAQIAAATLIPGVVFSGSVDGHMRAYSSETGSILWDFDTEREYVDVNGATGHGGSISGPGPVIVNGTLYVNSGYGLFWQPGNVLLAFDAR
jgi:polyvinyl alcohol dehydrogenase (cytochrome)